MKTNTVKRDQHLHSRRDALRAIGFGATTIIGWQAVTACSSITNVPIASTLPKLSINQGETTMSIRVQIASTVKKDKITTLMSFLEENLPNVRSFEGCLSVTVLMNKETGSMVLDEEWLSVDQHQNYISFIEENGILGQLASHFDQPPNIQYLDRILI